MHPPRPARHRRPRRARFYLSLAPWLLAVAAGAVLPVRSFLEAQRQQAEFAAAMREPGRQRREFVARLQPGDITLPPVRRSLEQFDQQEREVSNKLAPQVNASVALFEQRRWQGLLLACGGGLGFLVTWRLVRPRIDLSWAPAEVELESLADEAEP